jgi:hypothetical protein
MTTADRTEAYLWKHNLKYDLRFCELHDIDGLVVIRKWKYPIPQPTEEDLARITDDDIEEMRADRAIDNLIEDTGFKLILDYITSYTGERPDTEKERRQRLKKIIKNRRAL